MSKTPMKNRKNVVLDADVVRNLKLIKREYEDDDDFISYSQIIKEMLIERGSWVEKKKKTKSGMKKKESKD